MEKTKSLISYLRASFACFWMVTSEPTRVRQIYYPMLPAYDGSNGDSTRKFKIDEWDCIQSPKYEDPLIRLNGAEQDTIMFLYNYHFYAKQPKAIQLIQNNIPVWSSEGKAIVVVSTSNEIPKELEKDFTLLHLELPGKEQILEIMEHSVPDQSFMPKGEELDEAVKACKSLNSREIENVISLSIVDTKKVDIITINDYRAQAIKKSGFAEVMQSDLTFDDVIGYEPGKAQVMTTINNPNAKGVIWIGPPGTGKTSLGKAIANESKKLSLQVHTGKFLSKYVGESDRLLDEFFRMIYAIGECYMFLDEFDKQFAGGSGEHDGGTGKRQIGRWLEFFQDRPKGVYINTTCNSFVGVPSALFRAGRWDSAPWYVGMPSAKVRNKILDYYINKFKLSDEQVDEEIDTTNWVGAEIEALCHNANMRNLPLSEASQFIRPMYNTRREEIQALEDWAKDRTIDAEKLPKAKSLKLKRKLDV